MFELINKAVKSGSRGSILIEAAVAIPVLISLVYFTLDTPKYARDQSKMRFCTYCAVNMIQNITSGREDKSVTKKDMSYIFATAMIPFFGGGGNIQYGSSTVHPLGYWARSQLYYVKGLGNNRAKIIWRLHCNGPVSKPYEIAPELSFTKCDFTTIKGNFNAELDADTITPGLTIQKDKVKMIYEVSLCTKSGVKDPDGNVFWSGNKPPRSLWGFYLLTPEKTFDYDDMHCYFTTVTIFTPNPELFKEDSMPD